MVNSKLPLCHNIHLVHWHLRDGTCCNSFSRRAAHVPGLLLLAVRFPLASPRLPGLLPRGLGLLGLLLLLLRLLFFFWQDQPLVGVVLELFAGAAAEFLAAFHAGLHVQ